MILSHLQISGKYWKTATFIVPGPPALPDSHHTGQHSSQTLRQCLQLSGCHSLLHSHHTVKMNLINSWFWFHLVIRYVNICFCLSVQSMDFSVGISNPTDFNLRLPGSHNSHHNPHHCSCSHNLRFYSWSKNIYKNWKMIKRNVTFRLLSFPLLISWPFLFLGCGRWEPLKFFN